jgi:hypothetical protein
VILTIAQQIALARKHDFTDAELPDVCAVIMTESGGDTVAVQSNGLGRGLVQIDLGQHPNVTEAQAFDPDFAMAFARSLSRNASGLGATNWYGPRDHPAVAAKARSDARAVLAQEGRTVTDHRIIPRSEWGATPASGMAEASYPMSALWLHHSDTVPTDDPLYDMRLLQQIAFSRGFSDISYTYGLHPDGSICEGRDLRYVGAHTAGNNSTSLAFVLIGDYTTTLPTAAQIASARWLRDKLIAEGYLTPGTYPTGGHQDAPGNDTACPGAAAESRLDLFRAPQDQQAPDPVTEEEVTMFVFDGPKERGGGVWKSDGVFRNRINAGETWPALEGAGAKHIGVAPVGLFDDLIDAADLRGDGTAGGVDLSAIADRVAARVADAIAARLAS